MWRSRDQLERVKIKTGSHPESKALVSEVRAVRSKNVVKEDGGGGKDVCVWFVCNDSRRWVKPFAAAVRQRGLPVGVIDLAAEKNVDTVLRKLNRGDIVVNFLNPTRTYAHDARVLQKVGRRGFVIVNGSDGAMEMEAGKLASYRELEKYSIASPRTYVVERTDTLAEESSRIHAYFATPSGAKQKIVAKPNIGTEGREVRIYQTLNEALQGLQRYASTSRVSSDGVILLQENVRPVADDFVYRAEFVDGKLLYIVAINASKSQALCPCQLTKGANKLSPLKILLNRDLPVTRERMQAFKDKCVRLMRDKDIDACSFEFAVRNGEVFVYDVNILTTYSEFAEEEAGDLCPRGHEAFAAMVETYIRA